MSWTARLWRQRRRKSCKPARPRAWLGVFDDPLRSSLAFGRAKGPLDLLLARPQGPATTTSPSCALARTRGRLGRSFRRSIEFTVLGPDNPHQMKKLFVKTYG